MAESETEIGHRQRLIQTEREEASIRNKERQTGRDFRRDRNDRERGQRKEQKKRCTDREGRREVKTLREKENDLIPMI
jgi:hypothetical protein